MSLKGNMVISLKKLNVLGHLLLPLSQDKGTAGQATIFCPGTKGQRGRDFFLSRDKGTTGRPVPVCPGTSRGTSRPLETLVHSTLHKAGHWKVFSRLLFYYYYFLAVGLLAVRVEGD